jgi:hypothetical protein
VTGWIRKVSNASFNQAIENEYPMTAVNFVKTHGYAGPLYNHFNWGGYLIWALPNVPVAMDGRHNIHGDERLERSFETWTGQRNWASDPELSAARLVIGGVNQALVSLLRFDPRFHLVYEDDVAAVFVARDRLPPQ